ncbi:MAG: hypothetical protein V3U54_08915 [Thermodesulfobacteriota bacterium]
MADDKKKATKLPPNLVSGLNSVDLHNSNKSPVEHIVEARRNAGQSPPQPLPGQQPAGGPVPVGKVEVDGYTFPIFSEKYFNTMTLMLYIFSTVIAKKNPEVDKILKDFHFRFPDMHGKLVYPRDEVKKKKKVKSKRRKNAKSK